MCFIFVMNFAHVTLINVPHNVKQWLCRVHSLLASIDRFGELLYGRFYPLHLHIHQFDEYWLANNRSALLLKHIIKLFLQFAFW